MKTTIQNTTNAMKAKLVNIKTFKGRDGYGLNADLIVNGNKVAQVHDNGDGGAYCYRVFDESTFKSFKDYIELLPPVFVPSIQMELKPDIDLFIALLHDAQEGNTSSVALNVITDFSKHDILSRV